MKTCTNEDCKWDYVTPAPLNHKILLLTKDNQCLVGVWKGEPLPNNKTFKAWAGLPDRNRAVESQLGYL